LVIDGADTGFERQSGAVNDLEEGTCYGGESGIVAMVVDK
jgi:hypothetical protein